MITYAKQRETVKRTSKPHLFKQIEGHAVPVWMYCIPVKGNTMVAFVGKTLKEAIVKLRSK